MRLTEQEIDDLKPGTIRYLNPGETVDFAEAPRDDTLPELCRSYKRSIRRARQWHGAILVTSGGMIGAGYAKISADWMGGSGWLVGGWYGLALVAVGAASLLSELSRGGR